MPGERIRVNSCKYDNQIRKTWTCELVQRQDPLIVLVGEFDTDISHPGLGNIRRGTISREYYWLDRWYNIFEFHEPDDQMLRNYYCNFAMPPVFDNGTLSYIDLDIDIIVWPDLSYEVLDRDDFEHNATKFSYSQAIRHRSERVVDTLLRMIDMRKFPFTS